MKTGLNIKILKQFLIDSNKAGYAGGEAKKWIKEKDGSTTIPFTQGEWKSHDNFFGGEPYGGRIIVSCQNKPVWIMVYYGWVENREAADPIYGILKKALMRMPDNAPFRGPENFSAGEYSYKNKWTGDVDNYSGTEKIFRDKKLVYQAGYMGGLVDQ